MGGGNVQLLENLKLEGTSRSCSFLNTWKSWLHSSTNPKSKSMIYKILRQSDLYHNPDPLFRLVGEVNETTVMVEGQEARALIDSGSQLSAISLAWVKKLNLKPQQLQSILQIEGSGGLEVPYLGYVETHLRIPEIKAFDNDVLLLIVPDSAHTMCTPITLGTLHIDMAIKLATKKELENLNKQWKKSLIATKLTMKEAVNQEDAPIVSRDRQYCKDC